MKTCAPTCAPWQASKLVSELTMPGCQGTRRENPLEGVGPGGKLVLSADCGGTTTRYALSPWS